MQPLFNDPTCKNHRLQLKGWSLEMARRWNGGCYTSFVLHGNIFDLFPVSGGSDVKYVPLKPFLVQRLFPLHPLLFFYDISDGLTFGSAAMQKRFFDWLQVYDSVEGSNFHDTGPPPDFGAVTALLRRFFLSAAGDPAKPQGTTLVIDFPEDLIPARDEINANLEQRMNLVTLLNWASSQEMARRGTAVILITESAAKLSARLVQNPHVATIEIGLPDTEDRLAFLQSGWLKATTGGNSLSDWSDLKLEELALKTEDLNLLRIRNLLAEAIRSGDRITQESFVGYKLHQTAPGRG